MIGGTLARTAALGQRLDLCQFLACFVEFGVGGRKLLLQFLGGGQKVVAPLRRRLGKGGLGKMRRVTKSAAFLLGRDAARLINGLVVDFLLPRRTQFDLIVGLNRDDRQQGCHDRKE